MEMGIGKVVDRKIIYTNELLKHIKMYLTKIFKEGKAEPLRGAERLVKPRMNAKEVGRLKPYTRDERSVENS